MLLTYAVNSLVGKDYEEEGDESDKTKINLINLLVPKSTALKNRSVDVISFEDFAKPRPI